MLPTGRGSSTVDGTETKHVGFSIPDKDLPGTRLEIIPAFKAQIITIEDLDSLRSASKTQLKDPKFDAIGNVSVEFDDYVTLVVEGQVLDDLKARIIDAQGNILLPTSRGSSTVGGTETKDLGFSIPDKDLPGARLELIPFFKAQVITIENLASLRSTSETQLKDPRFDAIGNVSVEFDDYVTLIVKGQALPDDLEARIIDAQGNIWLPTSRGSWGGGRTETKDFGFSIPDKDLPGARLEIIPAFNSLEIPFEFSDITIKQ